MSIELRDYQKQAIAAGVSRVTTLGGTGLILGCGLGKTCITLRMLDILRKLKRYDRVLILCPPRVMQHWHAEAKKWDSSFAVHLLTGTPSSRLSILNSTHAGIYVLSDHLVPWIAKSKFASSFTYLVIDESSRYRDWSSQRTKATRKITPARGTILLSGTPTPNGMYEIFPQQYMLDGGTMLGDSITRFRQRWMISDPSSFEGRGWMQTPEQAERLKKHVAPYYFHMAAEDYLDVPPCNITEYPFQLPDSAQELHRSLKRDLAASALTEGGTQIDLTAFSGGEVYIRLRQLTGGLVYEPLDPTQPAPAVRSTLHVHDAKLNALRDLHEELGYEPLLVCTAYKTCKQMIRQAYPDAPFIDGDLPRRELPGLIERWKSGAIPLMGIHPAAAGHGVDGLQHGGRYLAWYTLTDSGEMFEQTNRRLYRTGQKQNVGIFVLTAEQTVDTSIYKVVQGKVTQQQAFLDYLKETQ